MSFGMVDLLPSPLALASYGISKNGFLPAEPPLSRIPHAYYAPWENIVERLPELLRAGRLRRLIDELPVLDTSHLKLEQEWRRAYLILAILTQAYIWQGPQPSERLPPAISIPFLSVASCLEVQPIATYAALNLWNYQLLQQDADLSKPDDVIALLTQTGTDDESWFFMISNAIEARAGPVINRLLSAMEAAERDDIDIVTVSLTYFRESLLDMELLLERMDERCSPEVFYHDIRPFLAGSMNMEAAGLPKGVFYDEGNGTGSWRKYRGGSNGQSSVLQCFDAILGVNHERCGGFHAEMREYMPGPHKRFLDDLEVVANIRGFVEKNEKDMALLTAYNEAVASLSSLRNKHIALVTRYIIVPSRTAKLGRQVSDRKNLATSTTSSVMESLLTQELIGTGGTTLIPFLKTSRDETSEAAIAQ